MDSCLEIRDNLTFSRREFYKNHQVGFGDEHAIAKNTTGDRQVEDSAIAAPQVQATKVQGMKASSVENFDLNLPLTIHSRSVGDVRGWILSISEAGVFAALPIELPIGETMDLAFHLPMGTLKVKAVVKSNDSSRQQFEFVDLNIPLELMRGSSDVVDRFRLLLVLAYVAGCSWRSPASLQS